MIDLLSSSLSYEVTISRPLSIALCSFQGKNDMLFFKFAVIVLLLITPANSLYAKMYKWVDQHGTVTYSNVTPPSSAQQVTTTKEKGDSLNHTSFTSATGRYFREDKNKRYIELHNDGSFFLHERKKREFRGKYTINGKKITFSLDSGKTVHMTIENNLLTDQQGRRWKKKLSQAKRTDLNVMQPSSEQQVTTTKQQPGNKQPKPGEPVLNGPLVASGTIKDQYNKTLSDVRVHVTEIALIDSEYNRNRSVVVHDGNFKISCDNCSAMTLSFNKEGYYSTKAEALYFKKRNDTTPLPELLFVNQDGTLPVVEHTNMEVILEQFTHDKSAKLVPSQVTIDSGPDWKNHVALVDGRSGRVRSHIPLSVVQAKSSSGENPLYIQLEPALDSSGRLVTVAAKPRPVPAPAILDFSHANGGIIIYESSSNIQHMAFREMKTAPKDGYKSRIQVKPNRGGDIYFYSLFNGVYGKGSMTGLRFKHASRKRKGVALGMSLYINPDGTRNLESTSF